jgi:2,2-dialkylglycine decarboxylase (pyruvate)
VLSAGGVIVPPPGYFTRMAELCDERGMHLVLDECQTGLGRLGSLYGFELYDVVPDFLVLSKTLGGGIPVSAVVTTPEIEERCFELGFVHVTSHVSDPLPAAVAEAVLDVVVSDDLPGAAKARGDRLMAGLRELQTRHESIGDVRGLGLLVGLELVEDRDTRAPADALGRALTEECLRCGLSMNLVRGQSAGSANCLRMAPPLTVSEDEIDLAITVIDEALTTVTNELAVR